MTATSKLPDTPPPGPEKKATFRHSCLQFWIICRAFFASERRHKARSMLLLLLILALSVGGVQVLMSYAGRDFMNAIGKKDSGA
jgi:putative ATP-binding cassette transporter